MKNNNRLIQMALAVAALAFLANCAPASFSGSSPAYQKADIALDSEVPDGSDGIPQPEPGSTPTPGVCEAVAKVSPQSLPKVKKAAFKGACDKDAEEDSDSVAGDAEDSCVVICHIPPGNPAAAHTICVGAPAVAAHVAQHGDKIGACEVAPADDCSTDLAKVKSKRNKE